MTGLPYHHLDEFYRRTRCNQSFGDDDYTACNDITSDADARGCVDCAIQDPESCFLLFRLGDGSPVNLLGELYSYGPFPSGPKYLDPSFRFYQDAEIGIQSWFQITSRAVGQFLRDKVPTMEMGPGAEVCVSYKDIRSASTSLFRSLPTVFHDDKSQTFQEIAMLLDFVHGCGVFPASMVSTSPGIALNLAQNLFVPYLHSEAFVPPPWDRDPLISNYPYLYEIGIARSHR
ncbi:hypothetical protein T440DRAFT_260808 [Plenodomus tracheiphilus IPT5]|uniref:Uncharacterized protein n=1 Tax=Plenodomus tracheiphilus IPT5 TaxID=1408161 RepID=A0A6A7ATY9_9PLEO|nr:hypothetical protein T440DRAFT_260808 [Plenodomus tracheiphilus IPT5]